MCRDLPTRCRTHMYLYLWGTILRNGLGSRNPHPSHHTHEQIHLYPLGGSTECQRFGFKQSPTIREGEGEGRRRDGGERRVVVAFYDEEQKICVSSKQEDAHEFLQCFLDRLGRFYDEEQKICVSSKHDNLVKQVFGGCLVSKVRAQLLILHLTTHICYNNGHDLKCCSCAHCSDAYERSIDLSLEIEDANNLLSALQSFTKVEKLDDPDTKFTCGNCKEQVLVEKQLSFDRAPMVAAFHLKRFKNDGSFVEKIDKHVSFRLDSDLLPFTASGKSNDEDLKYVLHAFVVHEGWTATSGHYYCFIRLSPKLWCKFDDWTVVLVHEDHVLSQEAYILFFAKQGTPWFCSFIEAKMAVRDSIIWNTSPKSVLDNTDSVSPLQDKSVNDSNEASNDIAVPEHRVVKIEVLYSRSTCRNMENDERKDNLPGTSASAAYQAHDSSDASWHETLTETSPLEKAYPIEDVPQTPSRSPSPVIYRECY